MMQQYMKELEQEPFDAEEFVERLAWRTIAETRNDGDEGDFNPTLLHESFVQAIKDLTLLEERQQKKCEKLETAVREDEAMFFQEIYNLLEQNKQAIDTFQELDGKINHVATKVLHLGDQLDSVNGPRARVVDAQRLMIHLSEFLSTGPLSSSIFTDPYRIDEAADIIQKLYLISQDLPSPKFESVKRKIERKYCDIEKSLIEEFASAISNEDLKRMKEIAMVLSHFKGYSQCIDAYIDQSQAGCLLSKDVFGHLLPLCKYNYEIIKKVFNNPEQVMAKFVLNLYQLKISEYIDQRLRSKLGSYSYLQTLFELYSKTNQLSNDLSIFNMGNDKNYLNKLTTNIYQKYINDYLSNYQVIDLKRRLTDTQKKNIQLEEESKRKEAMLSELSKSQNQKDKEYNDLKQKLMDKLKQTQKEENHYQEMAQKFQSEMNAIREELEVKTMQLDDVRKGALEINSSRCVQLACAQEEVNALKDDLNKILRKHCALNAENEKLHCQSVCMQATVNELEAKSQLLKGQLEQYLAELQCVQNEKEALAQKNSELLTELRSLQYACNETNKQTRYTNESVKLLESELIDLRNNRDDLCSESKNVINYVRAWLQEQKKLNEHTARRERNYCNTIQRLKQEYEAVQTGCRPQKKVTRFITSSTPDASQPPPTSDSPWSLGSQGTGSFHESGTPSRTPSPNQPSDWYCANFRNDSEEEEDDEDWVSKVEHLAAQVRKTNKMWKNKMGHHADYTVSKDTKK